MHVLQSLSTCQMTPLTRIHYIEEQYQGEAKEATKWPENDWYEMFRNHIEGDKDLMKAYEFQSLWMGILRSKVS